MSQYHEPTELLEQDTLDFTRALNSLKEEIEAVDWYQQRINASNDAELKAIMAHNRDEEIEHAAMTLEWLRRNMGTVWDKELRTYLFTEGSIAEHEDEVMSGEGSTSTTGSKDSLNIGDLK